MAEINFYYKPASGDDFVVDFSVDAPPRTAPKPDAKDVQGPSNERPKITDLPVAQVIPVVCATRGCLST